MSAIFCSNCGAKHPYNLAKPKFCSSCGSSLASLIYHAKKEERVLKKQRKPVDDDEFYDDDEDEDDLDDVEMPDISELKVDIGQFEGYPTTSLGSLLDPNNNHPCSNPRIARREDMGDFINHKSNRGR